MEEAAVFNPTHSHQQMDDVGVSCEIERERGLELVVALLLPHFGG